MHSTRTVLLGFFGSLVILAAPLVLNQEAEDEVTLITVPATPAAPPTRVRFDQAKSDAMQLQILNSAFYPRGLEAGQATVYVSNSNRVDLLSGYYKLGTSSPTGRFFGLRKGGHFRIQNQRFSCHYQIKSINRQGITINYGGSQNGPFGYSGSVKGQVCLKWEVRTIPMIRTDRL